MGMPKTRFFRYIFAADNMDHTSIALTYLAAKLNDGHYAVTTFKVIQGH